MDADPDLSSLDPALPDHQRDSWAFGLAELAVCAGQLILEIEKTHPGSTSKADGSPVTLADQASETLIVGELAKRVPWLTVIAEEQAAAGLNGAAGRIFALVDPLDVFWVTLWSTFMSCVAGLIPSWQAAKLDPVEALRYE